MKPKDVMISALQQSLFFKQPINTLHMAKYVILQDNRTDLCVIKKLDDVVTNICYDVTGMIYGFMYANTTILRGIVCCNHFDSCNLTTDSFAKEIKDIHEFKTRDINELLIRLETEGYVVELDYEPTSINDMFDSYSMATTSDPKDKLIAKMSIENQHLIKKCQKLNTYIDSLKFKLQDFKDVINADVNDFDVCTPRPLDDPIGCTCGSSR